MDIFFQDPTEVPLPPDEVRIRLITVDPMRDNRRVKVSLETDPFQKRPSLELTISDSSGAVLASASVIESMLRKIELVMHLRGEPARGRLSLNALLYYLDPIPEPDAPGSSLPDLTPPRQVDQRQVTFTLLDPEH